MARMDGTARNALGGALGWGSRARAGGRALILTLALSCLAAPPALADAGLGGLRVAAPFTGAELTGIPIPGPAANRGVPADFEMPEVFRNVSRIAALSQRRTLAAIVQDEASRRSLYRAAVLSALAGEELRRLEPRTATASLAPRYLDMAARLTGGLDAAAGWTDAILDGVEIVATQTPDGLPEVQAVPRGPEWLGPVATGLGALALAVHLGQEMQTEAQRHALYAQAAQDAEMIAALHGLARMVNTVRAPDPAMRAGILDALSDVEAASAGELGRASVALAAARAARYEIAGFASGLALSGGAALVVREAMSLHGAVNDFLERALLVAALHNLAARSAPPLQAAIAGQDGGGDVPIVGLAILHSRISAEAAAATHTALWTDRWDNALSLGSIGRGLGMSLREGLDGRDLRTMHRSYVRRLANNHLAALSIALPPEAEEDPPPQWMPAMLYGLNGHRGAVNRAVFSPDGSRIATTGADGTARLFDARNGRHLGILDDRLSLQGGASLDFSADGRRIVTQGVGVVRLWNATSGHLLASAEFPWDTARVAFSPVSDRVILSGRYNAVVLAYPSLNVVHDLRDRYGPSSSGSFLPDGRITLSTHEDGAFRILDPDTADTLQVFGSGLFESSADGRMIATGGRYVDPIARIYDSRTGEQLQSLEGHERFISSLDFSPDGARIVTGSGDGTARVWDIGTGRTLHVLRGRDSEVASAAFSPDGRHIATGGETTAQIWDAETGEEIAYSERPVPRGLRGLTPATTVAFSPTGRQLLIAVFGSNTPVLWSAR